MIEALVTLINNGPEVEEIYNGKVYTLVSGENILPKSVALFFKGKRGNTYEVELTLKGGEVCPLCHQSLPQKKEEEKKSAGATTRTLPSVSGNLDAQKAEVNVEKDLEEGLSKLDRDNLILLAEQRNINIDKRWGEKKLRDEILAS